MSKSSIVPVDEHHEDQLYRTVPFNLKAEQYLLGSLLSNNEGINRIGDYLRVEHFYEGVHRRIYEAIHIFYDRGVVATPVTLKNHFDKDEALTELGGADYLANLASMASTVINLEDYAKVIHGLAVRRHLIEIGETVVNDAYDDEIERSAEDQIESAEQSLFDLASSGLTSKGFTSLKESLSAAIQTADKAHKRKDKVSGVHTGFRDMDGLLGGFQKSDLLILAGRPSMGKTALAVNMALKAAESFLDKKSEEEGQEEGFSVGVFSLEMSAEQLAARLIAMESGVDSSKMRMGMLSDDDFSKLVKANNRLHRLPLFIDDTPALSISALRTRSRRLKRKNNLGFIIVDYLQLVRGSARSDGNRVQEVSEVTQGLKAIAKELDVPVIALSQLSRAVESREDKRPQLSDLRESGSIEQDADVVMFIFREEYYLARSEPKNEDVNDPGRQAWQERMIQCQNVTDVIVAKQRNGPIGTVQLRFNSNTTRFDDYDKAHSTDDYS